MKPWASPGWAITTSPGDIRTSTSPTLATPWPSIRYSISSALLCRWISWRAFGGKVVIQAKRYKGTVGVSAVRDLFGTVHNEGASKGILVTTSGYGSASFEFANGKPLELLDGTNLLYLLAEHAGIEARIEPPADWVDPAGADTT